MINTLKLIRNSEAQIIITGEEKINKETLSQSESLC